MIVELLIMGQRVADPNLWARQIANHNRDERYEFAEQIGDLKHISAPLFRALMQLALKDRDYLVRVNAVESLGGIATRRAAGILRKCILDKNATVRGYAAINFAEVLGARATRALKYGAARETNAWARSMFLIAIFKAGDSGTLDAILKRFQSRSFHVRSAIINGISDLKLKKREIVVTRKALQEQLARESSSVLKDKIRRLLQE